jgi:hypothetical protein
MGRFEKDERRRREDRWRNLDRDAKRATIAIDSAMMGMSPSSSSLWMVSVQCGGFCLFTTLLVIWSGPSAFSYNVREGLVGCMCIDKTQCYDYYDYYDYSTDTTTTTSSIQPRTNG